MNKKTIIYSLSLILSLNFYACKKVSEAKNEVEHASINKVELVVKESDVVVATVIAEDADGDGGNAPVITGALNLQANKTYTAAVRFMNIANGISKDVSSTIEQQGKDHEVFFVLKDLSFPIEKTDKDSNGFPLGLKSIWKTNINPAKGSVLIKLMHKSQIKGPNDDASKGHSDISISFPLNVN